MYKGHENSDRHLNGDLAQLVEHWHDDPEVMGSILTGTIFDNLTETRIVKN